MDDIGSAVDAVVRNRRAIAIDLLVVTVLVAGLWWLFDAQNYANWLYYVVLFGAVVLYATFVPFGEGVGGLGPDDGHARRDDGET